jgi:hypothetical protein
MEQARRDRGWPWEAGHDRQIFFAVAWMAVGGVLTLEYAGIASIEPVFGSGRDATSVIRVTPKEGEAFDLLVSNEESRDRAFAQRLRETWEKAR